MPEAPRPLFPNDENLALATDLYELTMAAGYLAEGMTGQATFELFVRRMPADRGYLVTAGLEQAVHYLLHAGFSGRAIDYLRAQPVFAGVGDSFFEFLRDFRFSGDVSAMPEGTLAFPNEPLMRVTAPLPVAQVVETYLLTSITFQTLVATKAARVVSAADGRPVVDFGSRRAHGPQAGMLAARASYIGGCMGTSNVAAGMELGIPIFGTQAHSWVMAFDDEERAFRVYHDVFPDHTTLLIDTYDTLEGARRATALGPKVGGVRLDSGDLAKLSKEVRRILDDAGMPDTRIIVSSDLNEHRIAGLLADGAAIDAFGVGTEMVTSADAPTLSGVYKLVEQEVDGRMCPRVKQSVDKATYPGRKQVYRRAEADGIFQSDVIDLEGQSAGGTPLLVPVLSEGRLVEPMSDLDAARELARTSLERLPAQCRRLDGPDTYPVAWSARLEELRQQALTGSDRG
jgi:nicotinate phosphoribosyltransferase